jgi:Cu-processing system ATP-binding protein
MQVTARNGYISELAAALPGAIRVDGDLRLTCAQDEKLPILARIAGFGDKVADIEVVPPSLEDIYSHFSRRDGQ